MDGLFNKFKKQAVVVKKKTSAKNIPSWGLREVPTKYDKYFTEGRPINPKKRTNAWFRLSGGSELKVMRGDDYYPHILESALEDTTSADAHQISLDIERTSLNDCEPLTSEQQQELFHVLKATAFECSSIGYCQSMNFLAAFVLRYLKEEEAFYTLVCLYTNLLPNYYSKNLFGMRVDEQVFVSILNTKLPDLMSHFDDLDVDITIIIFHWFLCLFINILQIETVEYIWDQLFYYGPHVIHAVCYRIFEKFSFNLQRCEDLEEIVNIFNSILPSLDPSIFNDLSTTEITLPQIRVERVDFTNILTEEEGTPALPDSISKSDTKSFNIRQSIRASFRVDNSSTPIATGGMPTITVDSGVTPTETSVTLEQRFKTNNSIILSRTQLNDMITYLRAYVQKSKGHTTAIEYCEQGMNKNEFMTFWTSLSQDIGIPMSDQIFNDLFKEFKNSKETADIRQVLSAFIYSLDDNDVDNRLLFFFNVYDIDNKNYLSKQDLKDLISTIYAMYPSLSDSPMKDINVSINSLFSLKGKDNQGIAFYEFKNMCLYHPFLNVYFGLLINDVDKNKTTKKVNMRASMKDLRKQVRGSLAAINDFDPIHDHFFQLLPALLPTEYQHSYEEFRSSLERSINKYKQMKEELDEKNRQLDQMTLRFGKANSVLRSHNLSLSGQLLSPVDNDDTDKKLRNNSVLASIANRLEKESERNLTTISETDDKSDDNELTPPPNYFSRSSIKTQVKLRTRHTASLPSL